jgi:hypothetical protein
MKKIIISIILFLTLMFSVNAIYVNTFTNLLTSENITFTSSTSYTRYLELPLNANVSTSNMSFRLYNIYNKTFMCQQEQANIATSCGGLNTGKYESNGIFDLPNVVGNFNDSLYSTYAHPHNGGSPIAELFINYTFPTNVNSNSKWVINFGTVNFTYNIDSRCFGNGATKLRLRFLNLGYSGSTPVWRFFCYDTGILGGYNTISTVVGELYEESMLWNITNTSARYNINLSIAGNRLYNSTKYFNTTKKLNFTKTIQPILTTSCVCSECILNGYICQIPFKFSSALPVKEEYSRLNVTYKFLINISFWDENTNALIRKNVTARFNTGTVSFNFTTDMGSKRVDLTDSTTYNILYYATGYTTRSRIYSIDSSGNPSLKLYLAVSNTTTNYQFRVINELDNQVAGAIVQIWKFNYPTNSFIIATELTTASNGYASTNLIPDSIPYRFKIYYNGELKWDNSPVIGEKVYSTNTDPIIFQINVGGNDFDQYNAYNNINPLIEVETGDDGTANITYSYLQSTPLTTICYILLNTSVNYYNQIWYQCQSTASDTTLKQITVSNTTNLQAKIIYKFGNYYYNRLVGDFVVRKQNNVPFNKTHSLDGVFYTILGLIAIALMFYKIPEVTIILEGLFLSGMIFTDILYLSGALKYKAIAVLILISVIVAALSYQSGKRVST